MLEMVGNVGNGRYCWVLKDILGMEGYVGNGTRCRV